MSSEKILTLSMSEKIEQDLPEKRVFTILKILILRMLIPKFICEI